MDNDSKLRLLYIGKMLQNTDEAHPLTNADMMQILEEKYGITTHRTTVPADIDLAVNHVFFGWVFGFGGLVKIKSPENIRQQYIEMVQKALAGLD